MIFLTSVGSVVANDAEPFRLGLHPLNRLRNKVFCHRPSVRTPTNLREISNGASTEFMVPLKRGYKHVR